MKKILSIITAAFLTTGTVIATPFLAPSIDSISEDGAFIVIDTPVSTDNTLLEGVSSIAQVSVVETTQEEDTYEKPANAVQPYGDSSLMFDFYGGGDGTADAPYEIHNETALNYFSQMINTGNDTDCHYKLTADIDLNGKEWTPVGFYNSNVLYGCAFSGSFDGNGHTISNFKITVCNTPYIGFFGLVYNGEIKNLNIDEATIELGSTAADTKATYAGILAGRFITDNTGSKGAITNCHITNSSVSVISDKEVSAAGVVGFALAGKNTQIDVYDISSDCDVYVSVNATEYADSESNPPKCFNAYGSSLFAYFGALDRSTVSLRKAHALGTVEVDSSLSDCVYNFAGGVFAQAATRVSTVGEVGGTAYISGCYSDATVTSNGNRPVFVGGFAGNLGATANMFISNCYASGDTRGSSSKISSSAGWLSIGGFVGQLDFGTYSDSMGKPFTNCYASGDVIDTPNEAGKSVDSYAGGFAGYSFAPLFKDCYYLESQTISGLTIMESSGINLVSNEVASTVEGYPSFDFNNTWQIDAAAEYPYPTLKEINGIAFFYNGDEYFGEIPFGSDGKVILPVATPEKKGDLQWEYSFSHWSLTQDGEAFDAENSVLTKNTVLYAVFSKQKKVYEVTFVSEGSVFGTPQKIEYGNSPVSPANVPQKPETSKYRYQFHHWSLTENGKEQKLSELIVTGNVTLYAVFTEINKTAWSGQIAESFIEGYGTQSLPYIIKSAEELALMAKVINEGNAEYSNAYFALGDDIHLGYYTWTPIGTPEYPFSTSFDGAGYSISCFSVKPSDYTGLFGYVKSATIKNLYISDFEISMENYTSTENVYVGALAGYIDCHKTNSIIDNICINGSKFDVDVSAPNLYAGNIAGYINTNFAKSLITNCYATNDITAVNHADKGFTYAGGLSGYMYTYAGSSLAKATGCYYIGTVEASADYRCVAGGLVGSVYSFGSAYTPPVEISELQSESTDYDVMLENCFSIANVASSSNSSLATNTLAGALAGEVFQYAAVKNVFFQRSTSITSTGNVSIFGVSTSAANLVSKDFLNNTVGFDFVNVWTYVGEGKYPSLKAMYSDKPILRINHLEFENSTLIANIAAFAKSSDYTVIVGIYNDRNQLIATRRQRFAVSDIANEFEISVGGIDSVCRIKISAYDSLTFKPLFSAVEWYL